MVRRSIKCSNEIYETIQEKQNAMQDRIIKLTGTHKKVSINKVLKVFVGTPVRISDEKLLKLVLKKRRFKR